MPYRHSTSHVPSSELPASLVEAMDAFLLACAARHLRGDGAAHCSMLVHVTRYNTVQDLVREQVNEHLRAVRQRLLRGIDHADILARLEQLWRSDFAPTTERVRQSQHGDQAGSIHAWDDVRSVLNEVIADIEVRTINGTAKDALDYADATGLKVIAIGGDKLARGLTLEGLSVSYFLRASKMYDTLMQMGRWFGYRPGYLDLMRLYTTDELTEWFGHIADAAEELRDEFDLMFASGSTPREYGLKVQSHPVLMVTSRLKMRAARDLMLSFSGQLLETIVFHRAPEILRSNLDATSRFLASAGSPIPIPERQRGGQRQAWSGFEWNDVPGELVVQFLAGFKTHRDAHKVNAALLASFVESMMKAGELTAWKVVLLGGGQGKTYVPMANVSVSSLQRKCEDANHTTRYTIGRLMSSRDEAIDLDEDSWNAALAYTRSAWRADPARSKSKEEPSAPNGPAIRRIRGFGASGVAPHRERGVLYLYPLDPSLSDCSWEGTPPLVIGFAVSFPSSESGLKVEYRVNNILWQQEYGASE
jgi:hypothetical protein